MQTAAILICIVLFGLSIFQNLLIAGYPLGHFAWGGQHKILPTNLRIGSTISIGIYILIGSIILDRVGIISVYQDSSIKANSIWILIAYFGLGIVLNGISRSRPERVVMTPIVTMLFLLCLFIGLNT